MLPILSRNIALVLAFPASICKEPSTLSLRKSFEAPSSDKELALAVGSAFVQICNFSTLIKLDQQHDMEKQQFDHDKTYCVYTKNPKPL